MKAKKKKKYRHGASIHHHPPRPLFLLSSYCAPADGCAVHVGHGCLRVALVGERHEPKPSRLACLTVYNNVGLQERERKQYSGRNANKKKKEQRRRRRKKRGQMRGAGAQNKRNKINLGEQDQPRGTRSTSRGQTNLSCPPNPRILCGLEVLGTYSYGAKGGKRFDELGLGQGIRQAAHKDLVLLQPPRRHHGCKEDVSPVCLFVCLPRGPARDLPTCGTSCVVGGRGWGAGCTKLGCEYPGT